MTVRLKHRDHRPGHDSSVAIVSAERSRRPSVSGQRGVASANNEGGGHRCRTGLAHFDHVPGIALGRSPEPRQRLKARWPTSEGSPALGKFAVIHLGLGAL